MGIVNIGTSSHVFSWKMPLTSLGLNQLTYKVTPAGIYDGFAVTKLADNQVSVAPGTCVIDDDTAKVSVKVKTETAILLSVSNINYFLVLRMVWTNSENYMDALSVEPSDVLASDVVIGKLVYSGATLSSIDYSYRSWGNIKGERTFLDPQANVLWIQAGTNFWFRDGWTLKYVNERTKTNNVILSSSGRHYLAYNGSNYIGESESGVTVLFSATKNGYYDNNGYRILAFFYYDSGSTDINILKVYDNSPEENVPNNDYKKYLDAALKQKFTYTNGILVQTDYYNDAVVESSSTLLGTEVFTYLSGLLTSQVITIYDPVGAVFKTHTYTFNYTARILTDTSYTIS